MAEVVTKPSADDIRQAVALSIRKQLADAVPILRTDSVSIPATPEMIAAEEEDNREILKLLEESIRTCGHFRVEMIPALLAKLRDVQGPFVRMDTMSAFAGSQILTIEEKRNLGLNTRMKYTAEYIAHFEINSLKAIEPKSLLECMHLNAFHRVARKRDLQTFRKLGFVDKVKIRPMGDEGDCKKIEQFRKIHSLETVPELPIAGCDAPFCRCWYEPQIGGTH
jgi:hypothetical protein